MNRCIFVTYFIILLGKFSKSSIPLVINTWNFTHATEEAWTRLQEPYSTAIDAITVGCTTCEIDQCEHTVGFGGSPDENGETTLDALIFDGATMDMGAVGGLRRVKSAIDVARHVLEHTDHSLLVGELATDFAKNFHYKEESLSSNFSQALWTKWKNNNCQPNFWKNVIPNPLEYCGPYELINSNQVKEDCNNCFNSHNHDTIGMIVIDSKGNVVAGTSTNGAKYKIPGRVGDSPIPGAGGYADNEVGAAVATGDGDIMMRFLPSFLAVEEMRRGSTPATAAKIAITRIAEKYPNFFGAVVAVTNKGIFGADCNGMQFFPVSVANKKLNGTKVFNVTCSTSFKNKEL